MKDENKKSSPPEGENDKEKPRRTAGLFDGKVWTSGPTPKADPLKPLQPISVDAVVDLPGKSLEQQPNSNRMNCCSGKLMFLVSFRSWGGSDHQKKPRENSFKSRQA
ncbi:MAG: hypothetical protein AB8E87_12260 [Prochlorococcus sp.]